MSPPDSEPDGIPNPHGEGDDAERNESILDPSFGEAGLVTSIFGNGISAFDCALQTDGKIVAAGYIQLSVTASDTDMAVFRYFKNGSLDTDFGTAGITQVDFGLRRETASGVARQPDGKIVISGKTRDDPPNGLEDFYAARFTTSGILDTTFSEDGKTAFDVLNRTAGTNDVAVRVFEGEPKVVLTGTTDGDFGNFNRFAVTVEFNEDGTPHEGFGVSGRRSGAGTGNSIMLTGGGGAIIAGGSGHKTDDDYQLISLDSDGDLTFFGDFGTASFDRGATDEEFHDVVFVSGVDTLVGIGEAGGDFFLLGIEDSGDRLEESFGTAGVVQTDLAGIDTPRSILQYTDGQVLVCGHSTNGQSESAVVAYNNAGSLDLSFGENGVVKTAFAEADTGVFNCFLQPDEKLVIAGGRDLGGGFVSLARYGVFDDDEEGVRFSDGALLALGQASQANVTVNGSGGTANLFW